jgi:hypothetical protein
MEGFLINCNIQRTNFFFIFEIDPSASVLILTAWISNYFLCEDLKMVRRKNALYVVYENEMEFEAIFQLVI